MQVLMQYRYRNPSQVQQDVLSLLNTYRSLRPRVEKFVHANGSESMLLQIYGTIPIYYKGAQYNIPIHIWVRDTHPNSPPMIYVVPTQDMAVRVGRHVDANGMVYMPELHSWTPSSTLTFVTRKMCEIFGTEPPVYAKSSSGGSARPQSMASSGMGMPQASAYGGSEMGGGRGNGGFDARAAYGIGAMGGATGAAFAMSEEERKRKEEQDREDAERKIMYQSMISAVTEKLVRQHKEFGELTTSAINNQFRIEAELKSGNSKISAMVLDIDKETVSCCMGKNYVLLKLLSNLTGSLLSFFIYQGICSRE